MGHEARKTVVEGRTLRISAAGLTPSEPEGQKNSMVCAGVAAARAKEVHKEVRRMNRRILEILKRVELCMFWY